MSYLLLYMPSTTPDCKLKPIMIMKPFKLLKEKFPISKSTCYMFRKLGWSCDLIIVLYRWNICESHVTTCVCSYLSWSTINTLLLLLLILDMTPEIFKPSDLSKDYIYSHRIINKNVDCKHRHERYLDEFQLLNFSVKVCYNVKMLLTDEIVNNGKST